MGLQGEMAIDIIYGYSGCSHYCPFLIDAHAHEIVYASLVKHQVQDVVDALVAWTAKVGRSPKETYIWYALYTVSWGSSLISHQ